jgi:hypothetical protein
MIEPAFFATSKEFRKWLERNASEQTELLVGFYKVDSGKQSMSWPESVDEALCYGWIDGVRKRIDDNSYQIRFTPRKPTSIWTQSGARSTSRSFISYKLRAACNRQAQQLSYIAPKQSLQSMPTSRNPQLAFRKTRSESSRKTGQLGSFWKMLRRVTGRSSCTGLCVQRSPKRERLDLQSSLKHVRRESGFANFVVA